MNKNIVILVLLITSMSSLWQIAQKKTQLEKREMLPMIYPGIGIAEIQLQDLATEIRQRWGDKKPDEVNKITSNGITEYLVLYRDRGMLFICDGDIRVKRIVCKNPALLVKDCGLRVGKSKKDAEKAYALESANKVLGFYQGQEFTEKPYHLIIYYEKGIAFTLVKERVIAITVFHPGTAAENTSGIITVGASWNELLSIPQPPIAKK